MLPRSRLKQFSELVKPRNSKARQWRAVQSGVNRGISFLQQVRISPKSAPESSGKNTLPLSGTFAPIFGPSARVKPTTQEDSRCRPSASYTLPARPTGADAGRITFRPACPLLPSSGTAPAMRPGASGNEPPFRSDDNRVKKTHCLDAVRQAPQVAQLFAVAEPDLNLVNCPHRWVHAGRNQTSDRIHEQ
jgi:hypothetical protein